MSYKLASEADVCVLCNSTSIVFDSETSEAICSSCGMVVKDDMESMGPVRLKDVDAAQMAMVQVAKDLAAKGEIMLAGAGGDDELIY